jgi:hypothetical protein
MSGIVSFNSQHTKSCCTVYAKKNDKPIDKEDDV